MKHATILSAIFLTILMSVMACRQKADTAFLQEQEEYQHKIEAKLHEVDAKIRELDAFAANTVDDQKVVFEQTLDSLEREKEALNERMLELMIVTQDNWEEVRSDIDQQLAKIEELLNQDARVSLK